LISQTTLDLEPRRLILQIPSHPTLDINLQLSDAEIVATSGTSAHTPSAQQGQEEPNKTLTLKRQREFNVDGAKAQWRVADGVLTVLA